MELNTNALIGLTIRLVALGIVLFFVIPRHIKDMDDTKSDHDGLDRLRWFILILLSLSVVASIPGVVYQLIRTLGYTSLILQNISTISTNTSILGTSILLILIYTYQRKDIEKDD